MDRNGQYDFEIYHRNSFDDEQNKEKKKAKIFIVFAILFFLFLFLRGCYLDYRDYENKVEGILLEKIKGSRGSYTIRVHNWNSGVISEYHYNRLANYDLLQLGDSLFKDFKSHTVNVYRREHNSFLFVKSFSIKRW